MPCPQVTPMPAATSRLSRRSVPAGGPSGCSAVVGPANHPNRIAVRKAARQPTRCMCLPAEIVAAAAAETLARFSSSRRLEEELPNLRRCRWSADPKREPDGVNGAGQLDREDLISSRPHEAADDPAGLELDGMHAALAAVGVKAGCVGAESPDHAAGAEECHAPVDAQAAGPSRQPQEWMKPAVHDPTQLAVPAVSHPERTAAEAR